MYRTGTEQSLTPEQSYKILCRATKVFREEYLHKLELARGDVDRRLNSLRMLKDQQLMEVKSLHNEKSVRTDVARDLAEKYEDVCERNESLVSRSVSTDLLIFYLFMYVFYLQWVYYICEIFYYMKWLWIMQCLYVR